MTKSLEKEPKSPADNRETRPAKEAQEREVREVQITKEMIGTIPNGFSEKDARAVIDKIGLGKWRTMGFHRRLQILNEERSK